MISETESKYEQDIDDESDEPKPPDFYSVDTETENKDSDLFAISEDKSINSQKLKTHEDIERDRAKLQALRAKYSSRRIILPEKDKSRTPQCFDCGGFYHIQSDPISAYSGVGIVCELCGKNRTDNPELLLENHYYKCEDCENVDICCKCYQKEKEKLIQNKESKNKPRV